MDNDDNTTNITPKEEKPIIGTPPIKSSMEILSELFSTFDAEPPLIIKEENTDESIKKHKKSKKKHKHKDKKHKKKDKKRKRSSDGSEIDLAKLLIKEERKSPEKKLKLNECDVNNINKEESTDIKKDEESADKKDEESADIKKDEESSTKTIKDFTKKPSIIIKNLKFSSVFEATIKDVKKKEKQKEEGELSDANSVISNDVHKEKKHKRKHKQSKHEEVKKKKKKHSHHRSKSREKSNHQHSKDGSVDSDFRSKEKYHHSRDSERKGRTSRSSDEQRSKERDHHCDEYKCKNYKNHDKDHKTYKCNCEEYRDRDSDDYKNRRYKDDDFYKSRDSDKEEKWFMRDRYRGYNDRDRDRRYRDRSSSRDSSNYIDKKKLLEIARKNAIQMMKSGNLPGALTLGPQAQEKVIAAIKAGGKTIEELTDFCKSLSRKEESGDLSSMSDAVNSDSDTERPFHHPFQIKDRPTSITMNIKNSVPLPIKTTQERTAELRMQFPVSSGQQHRKSENEWIPVAPKKTEPSVPKAVVETCTPLAIEAPPVPTNSVSQTAVPGPQVFPKPAAEPTIDIGAIVSQRLTAMRKLQENPHDVQAITEMYKAQQEVQTWAESKQQPGQFTGSTGAQILSHAELSSGYQAWARKDQLQNAAPVSGGMGMHLLQKMGWRPGEGLGKEKTGTLEPLLLEVKLDKKGLVTNEEQKKKQIKQQKITVKSTQGKHPVSLLGEYASKCKLGAPQYSLCFECGPDHKKNFLFAVLLNGIEYKPNVASPNKKEAKANAAAVCLQQLGLFPP